MSSGSSGPEEGEIAAEGFANEAFEDADEHGGLVQFFQAESKRGRELIRSGGFEYAFEAESALQEGVQIWRCVNRPPYCPGRVHVSAPWHHDQNGQAYKMGRIAGRDHNHTPTHESVRDAQKLLRENANANNPIFTRDAVSFARAQMPADIRAGQGTSSASLSLEYRRYQSQARAEAGDDLMDVQNAAEIVLPERLLASIVFEGFVNGRKMLVFSSNFGRGILARFGANVAIDGTFKTSPISFQQIYPINVIVDHVAIPAVYAFLQSKEMVVYQRLFEVVRNIVPAWNPQIFVSDFENSAIQAVNHVFRKQDKKDACSTCLNQCSADCKNCHN